MLLLVVNHLLYGVLPLLVDPVQEDGLVRLEVWLLHEEGPQAFDVFYSEKDRLVVVIDFLALDDQELDEVKRLLDSNTV